MNKTDIITSDSGLQPTSVLIEKAQRIKLLALDVDGVLTDGGIIIGATGELAKRFNAQDGLAIAAAGRHGFCVAIITGRTSSIVAHRAQEIGITELQQGIKDKGQCLKLLAERLGLDLSEIAYMGDDLNDLPALNVAGLKLAPANVVRDVRTRVDYITEQAGGQGAVREALELILKAKGLWPAIIAEYIQQGQGDGQ